jgi:hypothetical protein
VKQFVPRSRVEAADERFEKNLEYARKAEVHAWVAATVHQLSDHAAKQLTSGDGTYQPHLDVESLVDVEFGCYICEQPLRRELVGKRCKGEPK